MSNDASSVPSNGDGRRNRRRRRRHADGANGAPTDAATTNGVTAPAPAEEGAARWVDQVDALAGQLATLRTRGAILDHVVREVMKLLPAEAVIVHADGAALSLEPSRTVIPLATAGRQFGSIEIALKPDHAAGPTERALGTALVRQAALALERVALEDAAWPATPEPAGPAVAVAAADAVTIQRSLDRLATEISRLASLARSAALPPARRVEEAERTLTATLADLRARLLPG
jgi:hypothetical protein